MLLYKHGIFTRTRTLLVARALEMGGNQFIQLKKLARSKKM